MKTLLEQLDNDMTFDYISVYGDRQTFRKAHITTRDITIYLKNSGDFSTNELKRIIFSVCGFYCLSVELIDNTYIKWGYKAHTYRLTFFHGWFGGGFYDGKTANEHVNKILSSLKEEMKSVQIARPCC